MKTAMFIYARKNTSIPILKRKSAVLLALLIFGLAAFYSCHKKETKSKVVARIDRFEITEEDFRAQFKAKHPNLEVSQAEKSVKQLVLDDMIDQQLILMEAYRLGYDRDPNILAYISEKEKELAAEAYINELTNLEPITENLLKEYYTLMEKVFDLSYIRLNIDADEKETGLVRDRAFELYRQLRSGADFRRLAASHSEHGSAAADSGKIIMVDCYELDKSLIERLFKMKVGEISEPMQTEEAFFILKLDKVFSQKLADYQIVRSDIREQLEKIRQSRRAQKIAKIELALRKEYRYAPIPEHIRLFCDRTKMMKSRSDTLTLFNEQEKNLPLSKTDIEVITIGDFLPKVVEYYWDSLFQIRVVEMLLEYMNTKRLVKHQALKEGFAESSKVKDKLSVLSTYTLKEHVIKKEALDKITVPDIELQRRYQADKSSFRKAPQVTVHEIFCRTEADINKVHEMAVAGRDFALLQKKYSQDEETRTNGILGPFTKGRHGKLGESAFSGMKVGEISAPFRYRGGYSIFKLLSYEPERIESFADVKEQLTTQLLQENRDRYISDWLKTLRSRHRIQYDTLS